MSSPGTRRPQVRQSLDATGLMVRANQVGADEWAARWGATSQLDDAHADPWPPAALAPPDQSVTRKSTNREPAVPTPRVHASVSATLSLVTGTLAVAATLTGLLAPLGFAAGVLAVLLGVLAVRAVRRPAVNGHALVTLGLLGGLVAITLSLLAMTHSLSWLSNRTDEIAALHNWLDDHLHWLRRW